jgi:hypothetical protein
MLLKRYEYWYSAVLPEVHVKRGFSETECRGVREFCRWLSLLPLMIDL